MSLARHCFNQGIIWLVLPIVVVLAMYVSMGRYFFPLLENYRSDLLAWVNGQLAINLQVDQLAGQWSDFDPYLRLEQVTVHAPGSGADLSAKPALEVRNFSLELDSFSSFRYRSPVIRQASIQGVTLRLNQAEDGAWLLSGWNKVAPEPTAAEGDGPPRSQQSRLRKDVAPITRFLAFLLRQQHLKMEHFWLELTDRYGREYRAYSRQLEVQEVDGLHRLQGVLHLNPSSPQQIEFIMEIAGDPFDQESLAVDLYLEAESQPLASWLEKFSHLLPVTLPELTGGIELWGSWQGGRLKTLQTKLVDGGMLLRVDKATDILVSDLNAELFWQRDPSGWQLIADGLDFSLQERDFSFGQLKVEKEADDWQLLLSNLDLKTASETLLEWPGLPDRARDALVRLKPRGTLRNMSLTQSGGQGVVLRTDIDAVSVDAYYGAPVLQNVSGYVQSDAEYGFIRFHSDEFFMAYPEIYSAGWWFTGARGEVHWKIGDALRVYGLNLELNRGESEIAGEFDLHQPRDADDSFYLNVGLKNADEAFGLALVPDLILPEPLMAWLRQSVTAADVKQAGFVYDGTLNLASDNPEREVSTLLFLDIAEGAIAFLPEWPEADNLVAEVRLDGQSLDADLLSGRYLGNEDISGSVMLRHDELGSQVSLNLQGDVVPEWGWQIFTDTPLRSVIPESLLFWQLSGAPVSVATELTFPIDGREGWGQVKATTVQNTLLIPELSAPLGVASGLVVYDLQKGLTLDDVEVSFLGGQASVGIRTDETTKSVNVAGRGQAQVSELNRWQPMPFSPWVSGVLSYDFDLVLDRVSLFSLTSQLEDVRIDMPFPVGKQSEDVRPLALDMTFAPDGNQFRVEYSGEEGVKPLISHGAWGGGESGYSAAVWAGGASESAAPLEESTQRTDIYYSDRRLDLEPWADFLSQAFSRQQLADSINSSVPLQETTDDQGVAQPVRLHLGADQLAYRELVLNELMLDAQFASGQGRLHVASRELEGQAYLNPSLIQLDIDRLLLKTDDARDGTSGAPEGRKEAFNRFFKASLPNFDLSVKTFDVLGISGQTLDASYRSEQATRQIKLNNLSHGSVHLSGVLDWIAGEEEKSSVILNMEGKDLKDLQSGFAIPPVVSSSKVNASARLNWQGLPHDVEAETLNGQVSIQLSKGAFEQVQSVPALKLLSLFNFDSLVRRLQLDFSDLSGKGLSYDKVAGQVVLKNGIGSIDKPIEVSGTSTRFEMSGKLDFIEEEFDQELVVTLPVGDTLPFAAILAGAPQVGGTLYIAQKVFGNLFDKFTQATYTIKGRWDKPKIELKRVF